MLAASLVAVLLVLPDTRWVQTANEAIAATFYFENIRLAMDSVNYLVAGGPESVVQHYWSLSVEEQFYAVWPILLMAAAWVAGRRGRSRLGAALLTIGVLTVVSLAVSVWLTQTAPGSAYFATHGRMWEFGAGALLAAVALRDRTPPQQVRRLPAAAASVMGWLGLATIVFSAFAYSASTPFPGWAALLPVGGTAVVIAVHGRTSGPAPEHVLGIRPFQMLGGISYSLYLWHWPVVVIALQYVGPALGRRAGLGVIALSIALAWLTKRFVEDRYRSSARRQPIRRTYLWAASGMTAVALMAAAILVTVDTKAESAERLLAAAASLPLDPASVPAAWLRERTALR